MLTPIRPLSDFDEEKKKRVYDIKFIYIPIYIYMYIILGGVVDVVYVYIQLKNGIAIPLQKEVVSVPNSP